MPRQRDDAFDGSRPGPPAARPRLMLDAVDAFLEACIERHRAGADSSGLDAEFERLALRVFERQYESTPLYRRLADLRGATPSTVRHWSEIPAAPADLFREDLGLAAAAAVTFRSSGTTLGHERRSLHPLSATALVRYRRASTAFFETMVLPDSPGPMTVLVLGPTSATHPESSLGHMYAFVADAVGAERADFLASDGALDLDGAIAALETAAAGTRPVLMLALTTTITALFERLRARRVELRLPADSRLVDTGGSKGGRVMSRAGILHAAWRFLHIPAYLCVAEYGMTELLSQFYDDALRSRWAGRLGPRAKVGPAWTRTTVVDPATLRPVGTGERGILRHLDLANVESIAAVQTLDAGRICGEGFEVLGRIEGADARGCSQLVSMVTGAEPEAS